MMKAEVSISQLFHGLEVTKDMLDSTIGKPIRDSNGNTIGKIVDYSMGDDALYCEMEDRSDLIGTSKLCTVTEIVDYKDVLEASVDPWRNVDISKELEMLGLKE